MLKLIKNQKAIAASLLITISIALTIWAVFEFLILPNPLYLRLLPFNYVFTKTYKPLLDQSFRKRGDGFYSILFLAEKHQQRTGKPILIVETGSIRGEVLNMSDGASTFIFSHFLNGKNGMVHSVDLDPKAKYLIEKDLKLSNVKAYTMDSVAFLRSFPNPEAITLLYLDSYDVDFDFPQPAAEHHLQEIKAIYDKLQPGTIIVVDDNIVRNGKPTGKGFLVERFLQQKGVPLIYDGYQKVFQIQPNKSDIDELTTGIS